MIPRVPYGPKSPQVVREYAVQDTEFLMGHNVKMIVVACNTVSSVALDLVMKKAGVSVVGVIVLGAGRRCRNEEPEGRVIRTIGTIASNAYVNAIRLLIRRSRS